MTSDLNRNCKQDDGEAKPQMKLKANASHLKAGPQELVPWLVGMNRVRPLGKTVWWFLINLNVSSCMIRSITHG